MGLANKQIVKLVYKKAHAWHSGNEIWICDGLLPEDCKYFPFAFTDPVGKGIAKGKTVKDAWANAAKLVMSL
jgi:hypothetical protein